MREISTETYSKNPLEIHLSLTPLPPARYDAENVHQNCCKFRTALRKTFFTPLFLTMLIAPYSVTQECFMNKL
jgi:hypothetical protein